MQRTIRTLAALPLVAIGIQHLAGVAPLEPILEGAGIPLAALNARVLPVLQVLAGVLLVQGKLARPGALLTLGLMAGALYTHAVHDWADEPPILLPIAIVAGALCVLRAPARAVPERAVPAKRAAGDAPRERLARS